MRTSWLGCSQSRAPAKCDSPVNSPLRREQLRYNHTGFDERLKHFFNFSGFRVEFLHWVSPLSASCGAITGSFSARAGVVRNKRAMTERIVPQWSSLQMVARHGRVYPCETWRIFVPAVYLVDPLPAPAIAPGPVGTQGAGRPLVVDPFLVRAANDPVHHRN